MASFVLFQGKAVVIAKPNVDVRFGVTEVASRAGLSKEATLILHVSRMSP